MSGSAVHFCRLNDHPKCSIHLLSNFVWNEEHKEPAKTKIIFQNYSSKEGINGETVLTNELQTINKSKYKIYLKCTSDT